MKITEVEGIEALATKADIRELKNFILDRENALIWKVIALQVTLIGAIAGAQWAALYLILQHLQWKS